MPLSDTPPLLQAIRAERERSTPDVSEPGSYDPDAFNELHADRRYVQAIRRSRRQRDALERISGLLGTHPQLQDDPFELADLLQAIHSIDRRAL